MRYSKIILAAAVALVAVAGCKSQYEELLESSDVKAKYKAAFEYYNSGKYSKAVQLFESISLAVSGTPQDDTVQFYTAMANYNQRDFYTAEGNLTHFIENYPASPFIENAQFLRVDCLYRATLRYELDQKPTYAAITAGCCGSSIALAMHSCNVPQRLTPMTSATARRPSSAVGRRRRR